MFVNVCLGRLQPRRAYKQCQGQVTVEIWKRFWIFNSTTVGNYSSSLQTHKYSGCADLPTLYLVTAPRRRRSNPTTFLGSRRSARLYMDGTAASARPITTTETTRTFAIAWTAGINDALLAIQYSGYGSLEVEAGAVPDSQVESSLSWTTYCRIRIRVVTKLSSLM